MSDAISNQRIAGVVVPAAPVLDVMGPTVQLLTPIEGDEEMAPSVLRGTVPPGVLVPLHGHPDPETFLPVSGQLEGLVVSPEGARWVRIGPGDVFHVPGWARHAWRNPFAEPSVATIVTTQRLARFFQEVGEPATPGAAPAWPPSGPGLQKLIEASQRYGHWLGTPEDNARVGIALGPPE